MNATPPPNASGPCRAPAFHAATRRRGVALLLVMISVLIAGVLAASFLASQATTTTIARNVEHHAEARGVAESGLSYAVAYLQATDDWRETLTPGQIFRGVSLPGGVANIRFDDATGDFTDDTAEPALVRVVGEAGGVSHRVEARVTPTASGEKRLLLLVGDAENPEARDRGKRSLFVSWGYRVTLLEDNASQGEYDDAVADVDVVYVSETTNSGTVGNKLTDQNVGVVCDEGYLADELRISDRNSYTEYLDDIDITSNSHTITSGFARGELSLFRQREEARAYVNLAAGTQTLAEVSGYAVLVAAERGASLADGSLASGRRVLTPWGHGGFEVDDLTSDGKAMLRAALDWAAAEPPEVAGLTAQWHFNTGAPGSVDNVDWDAAPDHTATYANVNFPGPTRDAPYPGGPDDHFALRLTGQIQPPVAGEWEFRLNSDDGSLLRIADETVIENDGDHAERAVTGRIQLAAEPHRFETLFYENRGHIVLELEWRGPGVENWQIVPASAFNSTEQPEPEEPRLLAEYLFEEVIESPVLLGHWPVDRLDAAGVVVGDSITLNNHAVINSYDAQLGAYSDENRGADALVALDNDRANRVRLYSHADIDGDLYVGPTSDPDNVVLDYSSQGVSGHVASLPAPLDFPSLDTDSGARPGSRHLHLNGGVTRLDTDDDFNQVTLNNGAELHVAAGVEVACRRLTLNDGRVLFEADARMSVHQDLTLNNNSTIDCLGDVDIYVEQDLRLNHGRVLLGDEGTLDLFVGHQMEMWNRSAINPDSTAADRVRIDLSHHGKDLRLGGDVVVAGRIRVTDDATLDKNAEVFGSLSVGDDLTVNGRAQIHQDLALDAGASTGTTPDLAGTSPGWISGAAITDSGRFAAAASFDGDDDYAVIEHRDAYLLDTGSAALWFRTDRPTAQQGLFSKDSRNRDTGGHLHIATESGRVKVRLHSRTGDTYAWSTTPVQADTWHLVVFTWGPGGTRLYFDANDPVTSDYTGGLGESSGGAGNLEPIVLGANTNRSGNRSHQPLNDFFRGEIDDVRLYDRALSPAQVENLRAGLDPGEAPSTIVRDTSGFGDPLDLTIDDPQAVAWIDGGGIDITRDVRIASAAAATKLYDALTQTNQITVEAVFTPDNLGQDGPARIVSMSQDAGRRNFSLGQDEADYAFRLRTTESSSNGTPETPAGATLSTERSQHVIVSFDQHGQLILRRNGATDHTEADFGGSFSGWDPAMGLVIANEFESPRPWRGRLSRVAIYDRAVDRVQAERMFNGSHPGLPGSEEDVSLRVVWMEGP